MTSINVAHYQLFFFGKEELSLLLSFYLVNCGCFWGPVKVKVKVKSKFIKCHKNYTISTETEALATLRLAT